MINIKQKAIIIYLSNGMIELECREYEKQVQSFLKDEMEDTQMLAFMEHVQICPRCYEELEIYHSVYDGLELMEQEEPLMEHLEFADARLRYLLEQRKQRIAGKRAKRIVLWLLLFLCLAGMLGIGGVVMSGEAGFLG